MLQVAGAATISRAGREGWHAHQRAELKKLVRDRDPPVAEGPEEHADEAMKCLLENMRNPFENPLLVDLTVDASCADTWYEAK